MAKKSRGNISVPGVDFPSGKNSQNDMQPVPAANMIVDRRIKDCSQARELFVRLYQENWKRAQVFAQVDNQIDGGRPFDPGELTRNGEDWRTNANFKDAESAFNRAYLPYWKMVNEVPRKAAIRLHTMSPHRPQWEVAMAEAFDMFIDDWIRDYYVQFLGFSSDFVKYGPGLVMFPDAKTARFQWAKFVQMLWPRRTSIRIGDWDLVCMKADMSASELWRHIRNQKERKHSTDAGWKPEMVEQAIKLASPWAAQMSYFDPAQYQDMLESNDLVVGGVWPQVQVVHLWATNHDKNKVMHYIFTEKSDVPDYLYESAEEADSFEKIFQGAFYGVGRNGLIHTVRGFGVRNYYYATTINRTKCRFLDAGTFALGMNFKRSDNTPSESPPVENYSMVNIFPQELEQFQYVPQLGAGEAMLQMLKENQNENNYAYTDAGLTQNIAQAPTKGQGDIIAALGAEMTTSTSALFLAQIAGIFGEQIRRLCMKDGGEDAKKFQRRCIDLGCDSAVFAMEKTVKTGASPSMASPAVRGQIGATLMQTIYPLPGANRRAIEEFVVANLTGAEGVSTFLNPIGVDSDPRARREAIMENVDMGQGVPLPVDPSDAHVEHVDEHLKPLEAIIQAVKEGQQQMTPDHLVAFQVGLPHIEQHLQMLANDETQAANFKALNARFRLVQSVANGIIARLAKAQQSGASPDAMVTATQQQLS